MQVFLNALLNTLMGMGTVFVVLVFISLLISLFKYIPMIEERLKGGKKQNAEVEVKKSRPSPEPVYEEEDDEELVDDEALVAVITAAIMAYQGSSTTSSTDKLVVRSIRRAKRTGRR